LFACNKDNFLIIMHLGVVKVGLLWLAKPEVFCQCIIFKKNRWKIKYRPTLTTPNMYQGIVQSVVQSVYYCTTFFYKHSIN